MGSWGLDGTEEVGSCTAYVLEQSTESTGGILHTNKEKWNRLSLGYFRNEAECITPRNDDQIDLLYD